MREGRWWVRFEDVERAVIKELPPGFPILPGTKLRYQDALMVVRLNELNEKNATSPCRFVAVSASAIMDLLGAHAAKGQHCIFSDHGITEPDGSVIRMRTHQLRHYLNTLAQRNPMEPADLAVWSRRTDVRQNEAYGHESAYDILKRIREAIGDPDKMRGPLADLPEHLPISADIEEGRDGVSATPTRIAAVLRAHCERFEAEASEDTDLVEAGLVEAWRELARLPDTRPDGSQRAALTSLAGMVKLVLNRLSDYAMVQSLEGDAGDRYVATPRYRLQVLELASNEIYERCAAMLPGFLDDGEG